MRDAALALADTVDDPARKLNLLREYVQAFVLRSLHESEAFTSLAFVGGTALRFLENLPRFSEDLDFSVVSPGAYDPEGWLAKVRRDLQFAGFDCRVTLNRRKTVNASWIRIAGLLKDARLSDRREQNLSIKLDIDTRPPLGGQTRRTVIARHLTFVVCHHTLESLMAGKVHALLARPYAKGRDWFDLVWYRAHRPPIRPDLELLQSALDQTLGPGASDAARWRRLIEDKLADLDIASLAADVRPFLERPADRDLLTLPNLKSVLRSTD